MGTRSLRDIRLERDLLQREVASMAEISGCFYSTIENGIKLPSLTVAKRIAIVLSISLDELYDCMVLRNIK